VCEWNWLIKWWMKRTVRPLLVSSPLHNFLFLTQLNFLFLFEAGRSGSNWLNLCGLVITVEMWYDFLIFCQCSNICGFYRDLCTIFCINVFHIKSSTMILAIRSSCCALLAQEISKKAEHYIIASKFCPVCIFDEGLKMFLAYRIEPGIIGWVWAASKMLDGARYFAYFFENQLIGFSFW
jgi:hypothetical protein